MKPGRVFATLALYLSVTVVYFIAGKLGLQLAFIHRSVTAVWPPTGIALAACLLLGYRVWPGVFLGAFLVNITTAGTVATSLGIACGNTLEALVGAFLVRRFAHGCHAFDRAADIFRFALLAGLFSTMLSATVGVATLTWGGLARWDDYGAIWWTWWLGDAMGALLVTPLVLSWGVPRRSPWRRGEFMEALLVFLALGLMGLLVFTDLLPDGTRQVLSFLRIPLLAWMAFRFSQREVTTTVAVLAGLAIWGTLHGFGPFANVLGPEGPNTALLLLQTFMGVMVITTTVVAAVVAEIKQAKEAVTQLNQELERRLDEFQTLLHVIPIGIGVADDPACRHIRINPHFATLLHMPVGANASFTAPPAERPATFRIERDGQEIPPEDLPMRYAATHGVEVRDVEVDIVHADGQRLTLLGHAAPLFDAAGQVRGCIGAFLDITARTRAEAALREREAHYRLLTEAVPGVVWVDSPDSQNRYVNQYWCDYTGQTPAQAHGHGWRAVVHPDDLAVTRERAQRRQAAALTEPYEAELRYRRHDGVYRWFLARAVPRRDAQGRICEWVGTAIDIDDRKQTDAAIRAAHESLALAQRASASGVWDWDLVADQAYVSLEFRALHGLAPNVALNYDAWMALIHPADRTRLTRRLRETLERHDDWNEEFRIVHPIRGERWLTGIGKVIRDAQGRAVRMTGINIDMTARKRAEQALQQAYAEIEQHVKQRTADLAAANAALHHEMTERQHAEAERRRLEHETQRAQHFAVLGRLAAGVSHEIRNPLGAIFLHVDFLEEELREPNPDSAAEVRAVLAEIKTQLARLDDLVQDYLSLVRVANMQRDVQDLGAAVQTWGSEMQGLAHMCGATVSLESLEHLGPVAFHASTLRRAVLNLVQNALDAMPSGGTVTLAGQVTAQEVQLQVRDTGSGIPVEQLEQIFEPLYTTKPEGTGLGLYITQEIVAAHGGQLTVQSVVGQGTTFTITLPRAAAEEPPAPVIPA